MRRSSTSEEPTRAGASPSPEASERTVRSSIRLDCWAALRMSFCPSAAISPTRVPNSGERASSPARPSTYSSARRTMSARTASSTGTSPAACSARTGATGAGGVSTRGVVGGSYGLRGSWGPGFSGPAFRGPAFWVMVEVS